MTRIELVSEAVPTDVEVVWVGPGNPSASGDGPLARGLPAEQLRLALRELDATGAAGEALRIPTLQPSGCGLVLALGLGPTEARPESARQAAGLAARICRGRSDVCLPVPPGTAAGDLAEGWLLGDYRFDRYRTTPGPRPPAGTLRLVTTDPDAAAQVRRARAVAEAVGLCRDLVNTPAADLTPAAFADLARGVATDAGLTVEVLDETELERGGYGALCAVGKGSVHPPRLVRVEWSPPEAASTIALVGKGITFDSGGLSLKPTSSMVTMKADMAGAAVVLAVVQAAARLRLPVRVVGWLALAENMPGGAAMRPSDVVRTYSGQFVEIADTDAEGRLVLADAIGRAVEEPLDALVDIATLTGSHVPALGAAHWALVSDSDPLRDRLLAAGDAVGEPGWAFPVVAALRPTFASRIADLRNVGDGSSGKLVVGGMFLREFVPPAIPWAHLDIAGVTTNHGEDSGYRPRGATGTTVRALLRFLEAEAVA